MSFSGLLKKICHVADREIDYLFFRRFVSWREVHRHHRKRYSNDAPRAVNTKRTVVFMADGFRRSSGLADRLRGIVSLFGYCTDHGLDFRIYFTHPFLLSRYMIPADYDWRFSADQMCWNSADARAFHLVTVNNDNRSREIRYQRRRLSKCLSNEKIMQAHVYTAFDCEDERFDVLFKRLFRPAPKVQAIVDEIKQRLGDDYISVSARFMELLGDFVEPKQARVPLDATAQRRLMDACIEAISRLRSADVKVLLTSDSMKFLRYASERLDFVEYIEGDVCHISVDNPDRDAADLKTFADFFAIAGAAESYLLLGPGMYPSNFSKRAAQADGHKFRTVRVSVAPDEVVN